MIRVSVIIATYNQERYIAKAIESVICQKCDFEYEVLIGDDASNDGTGEIVRKYADENPELISGIVRNKNLGPTKNFMDLFSRAKGEYIALLEGDDYWTDDKKLNKQVCFLDSHPEYVASFGRCIIVDENGCRDGTREKYMTWIPGGEYTVRDVNEFLIPGQTATVMYRKAAIVELLGDIKRDRRIMPRVPVLDFFLILGILSKGKIYTLQDELAAYRYVMAKDSGSWSSKNDFFSFRNVIFFLYRLKEMERIGKLLGMELDYDNRRWHEFEKVAEYKGELPFVAVNVIRFFIWLWYRDKKEFNRLFRERHRK